MNSLFFFDSSNNKKYFWQELIDQIHDSKEFNPFCKSDDYFEVFKQIVISILLEEKITLLDSDFSHEEIFKLTGLEDYKSLQKGIDKTKLKHISTKSDLIRELKNCSDQWEITLYTSGTTGLPKSVTHKFQSFTRYVKISESNSNNVWGFAYNPTHMAGLQVFFQALMNGNSIIRLFELPNDIILSNIQEFNITHISATPTFYRLLDLKTKTFPSVLRIISGGEKIDLNKIRELNKAFINAEIRNVYASTEAGTLFASQGDQFSIRNELKNFVKLVENELHIHKSLLGQSGFLSDEWYASGDLVEIINQDPLVFKFLSRKNEMINVAGYKVNPNEVEEVIREINGVNEVSVFAKKNSVIGNIICCEIVKGSEELTEADIRKYLQSKLQEFKLPRIIKFVSQIKTTRTGKLKRK